MNAEQESNNTQDKFAFKVIKNNATVSCFLREYLGWRLFVEQ